MEINYDVHKMIEVGSFTANEMIRLVINNLLTGKRIFPHKLPPEYDADYVAYFTIGAISEYHNQLRNVLLKNGIDIGNINDPDKCFLPSE